MLDTFTIGGAVVDPIATELLPIRFSERFGATPTLILQRRGVALSSLPDVWLGQSVTWTNSGTTYFVGTVVSLTPNFDERIGWILTYQCLGQRYVLDWFSHTDSATGNNSSAFNLTLEDPNYNPARAGRTVAQVLTAVLTMPANVAYLYRYGIGGFTSSTSTTLPTDTVNDLAPLTLVVPQPLTFCGELFGSALDGFLEQWAPNVVCRIDPSTGHFRFLDTRTYPATTLTMGVDLIEPTPLERDVSQCSQRVVVREAPIAVMALLKQSAGDLIENFAWGAFTNAQAIAHWTPADFKGPQGNQDTGTCTCPSTTQITVTSSNSAESWTTGFWDQSHSEGTINLRNTVITDYQQFWHARIVACPALSPGGSCTLTIDNPVPQLNYSSYTITGLATAGPSIVWRQYQIANHALWPRVTNQSTYPQAFSNPGGGAALLTSTPMSQILWSLNGSPPYTLSFPLPFSTNGTTATGNILFVAPTYAIANNAPPGDVSALIPIQTNPNQAIEPPNDALGNPQYTGTSYTVEGWTNTLTLDLPGWRDPSLLSQVQAYASDVLDSVKNTVVEGAVVYYGFWTPGLTFGTALNVAGRLGSTTYATLGWDTISDLAIREVSIEWPQTEGMAYKTMVSVSNRRKHFSAEAYLHPERRFLPIGGEGFELMNQINESRYHGGTTDFAGAASNLGAFAPDFGGVSAAGSALGNFGVSPGSMAPGDLGAMNPNGLTPPGYGGPGDFGIPTSFADLGIPTDMSGMGIPTNFGDLGIPTNFADMGIPTPNMGAMGAASPLSGVPEADKAQKKAPTLQSPEQREQNASVARQRAQQRQAETQAKDEAARASAKQRAEAGNQAAWDKANEQPAKDQASEKAGAEKRQAAADRWNVRDQAKYDKRHESEQADRDARRNDNPIADAE